MKAVTNDRRTERRPGVMRAGALAGLLGFLVLVLAACQAATSTPGPTAPPAPAATAVIVAPSATVMEQEVEDNVETTPTQEATETPTAEPTTETSAGPQKIIIVDSSFSPSTITVPAGTKVVWAHNGSRPHTVTADDGSFASGTLQASETFEQTFSEAGTYPYYCEFHGGPGGNGMSGAIVVTGAP